MPNLEFQDWGLIDYQQALDKQLELVDLVSREPNHPGFLIFCSHPHVVTTGRQTKPEDIFAFKGPIIEVSRGGRATYHGPSQLVVYPIINLKNPRAGRGPQEIRGYLRDFEKAIVLTLKEFGIEAVGKTAQKLEGADAETDETGVWIGHQKIASLGIAVKKWVTYHGAALNVDYDPEAFQGLNPCGFKTSTMTSMETQLNKKIDSTKLKEQLEKNLLLLL
ncbi:MAG: lipoyl(octanoyl) transferase LipB [Pseudobdellovibrio sp.]